MTRLQMTTAVLALTALASPVMAATADDSAPALATPDVEGNATPGRAGIVGVSALRPDGTVAGVVQEVVRNEQDEPVHIVVGRSGENDTATSGQSGGGALSFSEADRDRYEVGWDASLGDWADMVDARIDELGDEAAEGLEAAWNEVESTWAALREESGETWHRTQASFEAAFDAFEREWSRNMAS